MGEEFKNLLAPYQLGSITIKNRFCVAPMAVMAYTSLGELTENAVNYMVERAKGGFGLIFTGAFMTDTEIDPYSISYALSPRYLPGNFVRSSLSMTQRIHSYGAKIFGQITMGAGRNYLGQTAPSETITFFDPTQKARALTKDEIKRKIEMVVEAAAIMKSAQFDGVEIHAMHWGYLLDEFAMSITNQRTDEYGGSLENRLRCAKEIVQGVKQVCGADFPVSMRLGLKSYIKGLGFGQASLTGEDEAGRTLEEGLEICKLLESYGYDCLSVDVGVYESFYQACPPMYMPKGHVLDLAAQAKKIVKIPILTGSRMDDPTMCEQAIQDGKTDAVVLGRASLADPYFPMKVAKNQVETIRPCIACNQGCIQALFAGESASCAVNPTANKESYYGISKAIELKKVVVVGGGVAGMEVARTAKLRGHDVSLYEGSTKLGGNLIPAAEHSFKKDVQKLNEWYQRELQEKKIPVQLNTKVNADMLKNIGADVVVLAVGSVPIMPKLPGMDHPKVSSSIDALLGKKKIGQKVVVIGGGLVGCEIALAYAMEGKKVTIVEALGSILSAGIPVPIMNSMMINDLLAQYKVEVRTGFKLASVNDVGAVITATEDAQKSEEIAADSVVIAIGYAPAPSMIQDLAGSGYEIYQVGDGNKVGNIMTSIGNAYEVARSI